MCLLEEHCDGVKLLIDLERQIICLDFDFDEKVSIAYKGFLRIIYLVDKIPEKQTKLDPIEVLEKKMEIFNSTQDYGNDILKTLKNLSKEIDHEVYFHENEEIKHIKIICENLEYQANSFLSVHKTFTRSPEIIDWFI